MAPLLDSRLETVARILASSDDEVLQTAGQIVMMRLEILKKKLGGWHTGPLPLSTTLPLYTEYVFGKSIHTGNYNKPPKFTFGMDQPFHQHPTPGGFQQPYKYFSGDGTMFGSAQSQPQNFVFGAPPATSQSSVFSSGGLGAAQISSSVEKIVENFQSFFQSVTPSEPNPENSIFGANITSTSLNFGQSGENSQEAEIQDDKTGEVSQIEKKE